MRRVLMGSSMSRRTPHVEHKGYVKKTIYTNRLMMINDKDALLTLQRGVNAVADAVRLTYGPGGRNVIIQKAIGKDVITKDGVSVAKDIWFTGALNAGASTLINAAAATSKATGDGTTTTVILAQALLNEGVKMVEA